MVNTADAEAAISSLNKSNLNGQEIEVEKARPSKPREGRERDSSEPTLKYGVRVSGVRYTAPCLHCSFMCHNLWRV